MAQFDVFENPIAIARRAYPFVTILQSDFAQNAPNPIVAPLVALHIVMKPGSRLTPIVSLEGAEHLVLVPALTGVQARELKHRCGSIADHRGELLSAIDFLFFGV